MRWAKTYYFVKKICSTGTYNIFTAAYLEELRTNLAACSLLPPALFPAAWRADGEAFVAELTTAVARIAAGETDVEMGLFPGQRSG